MPGLQSRPGEQLEQRSERRRAVASEEPALRGRYQVNCRLMSRRPTTLTGTRFVGSEGVATAKAMLPAADVVKVFFIRT